MTPAELNRKGFQVLVDNLGYVDAVRFIKQFDNGEGDYQRFQVPNGDVVM